MRHLLLAKGLWGHADSTDIFEDGASDQVWMEFQQKSQKAFSMIVMAISTAQPYLVTSCEQPKELLDDLHNHFEHEKQAVPEEAVFLHRDEGGRINGSSSEVHERNHRHARGNWSSYFGGGPSSDAAG